MPQERARSPTEEQVPGPEQTGLRARAAAAPRRAALTSLGRGLAWIVLVGGLLPYQTTSPGPGVDASWVWGINQISETGAVAGRDYVFPYGPFGAVVAPLSGGPHRRAVVALRLLLHLLFALALARALRGRPVGQVAGFTLVVLLGSGVGLLYEVQLLFWVALLFALATRDPPARKVAGPLGAALAVFLLLTKISLGVCALTLLAGFALWLLAGLRAVREVALLGLTLALAAGLAVAAGFGSLAAAASWLSAERELLRGMSAAMSLPGPEPELAGALVCLLAFAALALGALAARTRLAVFLAISAPVLGLVFRHGFVRQDIHVAIFFGTILVVLGVALLFAGSPRELAGVVGVTIIAATAGVGSSLLYHHGDPVSLSAGLTGFGHPREALGWETPHGALEFWRVPLRLPETWLAPLRAANVGVDSVPNELSLIAANRLRWIPSPTLQLYIAYTGPLDERDARHFAGAGAPDLLFLTYETIDGRNPLWDPPATWAAILRHYALAPSPEPRRVVLRRRPSAEPWASRLAGRVRFAVGDWVPVPATEDLLFADLDLLRTPGGRLREALFRVEPVYAVVEFEDGRRKRWRILPDTARHGLLLHPLPRNAASFPLVFASDPAAAAELPRALRLRLTGPGCRSFEETATLSWRAVRRGRSG